MYAFWHVMGELFGAVPSLAYRERVALLRSVVVLWFRFRTCTRPASLDASIAEKVTNDFRALFLTKHHARQPQPPPVAFRRHGCLCCPKIATSTSACHRP